MRSKRSLTAEDTPAESSFSSFFSTSSSSSVSLSVSFSIFSSCSDSTCAARPIGSPVLVVFVDRQLSYHLHLIKRCKLISVEMCKVRFDLTFQRDWKFTMLHVCFESLHICIKLRHMLVCAEKVRTDCCHNIRVETSC